MEFTPLETLENWITKYDKQNGNPPIAEILYQIDMLKDVDKEKNNRFVRFYEHLLTSLRTFDLVYSIEPLKVIIKNGEEFLNEIKK
jgi:hypothetical protein